MAQQKRKNLFGQFKDELKSKIDDLLALRAEGVTTIGIGRESTVVPTHTRPQQQAQRAFSDFVDSVRSNIVCLKEQGIVINQDACLAAMSEPLQKLDQDLALAVSMDSSFPGKNNTKDISLISRYKIDEIRDYIKDFCEKKYPVENAPLLSKTYNFQIGEFSKKPGAEIFDQDAIRQIETVTVGEFSENEKQQALEAIIRRESDKLSEISIDKLTELPSDEQVKKAYEMQQNGEIQSAEIYLANLQSGEIRSIISELSSSHGEPSSPRSLSSFDAQSFLSEPSIDTPPSSPKSIYSLKETVNTIMRLQKEVKNGDISTAEQFKQSVMGIGAVATTARAVNIFKGFVDRHNLQSGSDAASTIAIGPLDSMPSSPTASTTEFSSSPSTPVAHDVSVAGLSRAFEKAASLDDGEAADPGHNLPHTTVKPK